MRNSAERCFDYAVGALPRDDGTVRFRLWAPSGEAGQVGLELDGQPMLRMDAQPGGYYELTLPCEPGTRYRYRVGQDCIVPDPASRQQDGDVHDASIVCDMDAYQWENSAWRGRTWTDAVLYEIHCGLAGGFEGVERRLADLAQLGVTAIELMPIADFPGPRNWGYDGVLPYAPDASYGTPDQLRHLVDAAHGMGLMVFLDVVYNHFGPEGNYLPSYAAPFFRSDRDTPWGPAIDFEQGPVRSFFAENALFWLREYRFDGLRLDAVHAITDADWLVELAEFVRSELEPDRLVHLVLENDNNAASLMKEGFDAQWNDDAHHILHHILTGETQGYYMAYTQEPTAKLARFLSEGFVYQGEPSEAHQGRSRGEPSVHLAPTSFVCFLQNHDQIGNRALGERLISLCEPDLTALHAAVALQLLIPHIPLLFMGEEQGATAPFQYFTAYEDPALADAVREGRRNEFAAFHEFSSAQDRLRIPDPNDIRTWESAMLAEHGERSDSAGHWYDFYRRLLGLRRGFITPYLAGARSAGVDILAPLAVHARWILSHGGLLSIYCNLSQTPCKCPTFTAAADDFRLFASKNGAFEILHHGQMLSACTVAVLRDGDNSKDNAR